MHLALCLSAVQIHWLHPFQIRTWLLAHRQPHIILYYNRKITSKRNALTCLLEVFFNTSGTAWLTDRWAELIAWPCITHPFGIIVHCVYVHAIVYLSKNFWFVTNAEHSCPRFTRNTPLREMQDGSILVTTRTFSCESNNLTQWLFIADLQQVSSVHEANWNLRSKNERMDTSFIARRTCVLKIINYPYLVSESSSSLQCRRHRSGYKLLWFSPHHS